MKLCSKCGKNPRAVYPNSNTSWCGKCQNESMKIRNREKIREKKVYCQDCGEIIPFKEGSQRRKYCNKCSKCFFLKTHIRIPNYEMGIIKESEYIYTNGMTEEMKKRLPMITERAIKKVIKEL